MPRRARSKVSASFFHVVNRSIRKQPVFLRTTDYKAFLKALRQGLDRYPIRLIAYCLMPNHWHLIVGPNSTESLSRFMQWVTATHATRWHRNRNTVGQGPVYQGRFSSVGIASADDLMLACRYVERNALQAGLVRRAQDWPWGSLSERMRPQPRLPLVNTPFLISCAWTEYVNAPRQEHERLGAAHSVPHTVGSVEKGSVPLPHVLPHVAEEPRVLARVVQRGEQLLELASADDQHQPDAHVERPKHLRVPKGAGALQPRKNRRSGPALVIK